jgi:hypothetical protein
MDNVGPDRIGVSVSGPRDWDFGGHPQGELGGGFFFVLKREGRSRAGPLRRLLDNVGPNLGRGVGGWGTSVRAGLSKVEDENRSRLYSITTSTI